MLVVLLAVAGLLLIVAGLGALLGVAVGAVAAGVGLLGAAWLTNKALEAHTGEAEAR